MVSDRYCDGARSASVSEQDRLLQFAAAARASLDASAGNVALISRTGVDLSRLNIRYSHSGIAIRPGPDAPWSVRQLYYACHEGRPRLFDQGIGAFLFNTDKPGNSRVSIVFMPAAAAASLHRIAMDSGRALRLLGATYSANAYPFSVKYQNCNQWVAEMLALAWGNLGEGEPLRERAQQWLAASGFSPPPVSLGSHWVKFMASLSPMIHLDDHPSDDQAGLDFQLSLPQALEQFISQRHPDARRVELCLTRDGVLVREGWPGFGDHCSVGPGDRLMAFD